MKKCNYLFSVLMVFVLVFWNNAFSQSQASGTAVAKYPGFIGSYIYYPGTVYSGWGLNYNDSIQVAFPFGVYGVVNAGGIFNKLTFKQTISRVCTRYGANQVYGVIFNQRAHGSVFNQPSDTSLYSPDASSPGMMQAVHRFSRLSKIYPQISGVILDDFGGLTNAQLYQVREALRGKSLDSNGVVIDSSPEITPNLKLFICYYQSLASNYPASIDTLIDGVNLWVSNDQNVNYVNLDKYVAEVRQKYPGTAILTGADLTQSRTSIYGLIHTSDSLYNKGEISGMILFQEGLLCRQYISQARWDSLAIPAYLDSSYYPYLGKVSGKVVDAGGNPIPHAKVTVQRIVNGDTILVTRKYTDENGQYSFSGSAGRDSTITYQVVVQDSANARSVLSVELQGQKDVAVLNRIIKDPPVSSTRDTTITKYPGFIGIYPGPAATVYGGWGISAGDSLQTAFNFGTNIIPNVAYTGGTTFKNYLINNCTIWNVNKVYGLLLCPTQGLVNNPADTSLYAPIDGAPGMIQGARRFSELSKTYPQICGVIVDDYIRNWESGAITIDNLKQIREALHGEVLDANGNVVDSTQTTPNLKLYISDYLHQQIWHYPSVAALLDGIGIWDELQNDTAGFNSNRQVWEMLDSTKLTYPKLDIMAGVYIESSLQVMTPTSVRYMLQRSVESYDRGKISGVILLNGYGLAEKYITLGRWDSLAIPALLDSLYYPYLGTATGRVVDAGGNPISHAKVTVERIMNGDTIIVARKYTDRNGHYSFSGWAGRDSTMKYQVVVDDSAYGRSTLNIELQAQKNVSLLNIVQTVTGISHDGSKPPTRYSLAQNFPNPFNPSTTIGYALAKPGHVTLRIYDVLGRQVANLVEGYKPAGSYSVLFDGSGLASGVYFYRLSTENYTSIKKMLLLK